MLKTILLFSLHPVFFSAAWIRFPKIHVYAFENEHANVCVETTSLLGDDIDIKLMSIPAINITRYTNATGK